MRWHVPETMGLLHGKRHGAQCTGVVTSMAVYAQGAIGARAIRAWESEPDVRGGFTTHAGLTIGAVRGTSEV